MDYSLTSPHVRAKTAVTGLQGAKVYGPHRLVCWIGTLHLRTRTRDVSAEEPAGMLVEQIGDTNAPSLLRRVSESDGG